MAASQTADVEDRAGRGHETYDDADGDNAADGSGPDGTGTTPVPVPLRAQTCAAGGIPLGEDHGPGGFPSALGLPQMHYNTTKQQKSDTPLPEDISNRDLPSMAASQTADVEDRAGGGHGTDDDADGADAGDGAQ